MNEKTKAQIGGIILKALTTLWKLALFLVWVIGSALGLLLAELLNSIKRYLFKKD